jgi:hypothetical protein
VKYWSLKGSERSQKKLKPRPGKKGAVLIPCD